MQKDRCCWCSQLSIMYCIITPPETTLHGGTCGHHYRGFLVHSNYTALPPLPAKSLEVWLLDACSSAWRNNLLRYAAFQNALHYLPLLLALTSRPLTSSRALLFSHPVEKRQPLHARTLFPPCLISAIQDGNSKEETQCSPCKIVRLHSLFHRLWPPSH